MLTSSPSIAVLRLLPALLLLTSGCATTSSRLISGQILGAPDPALQESARPIENARVLIAVSEPTARPEEGPRYKLPYGIDALTNLRGLTVTDRDGRYRIDRLFTPWVEDDHPLLMGWTYEVEVIAPGYYIYRSSFVYQGAATRVLDWVLEPKPHDVEDTTGGVSENTHLMQRAAGKRFE